jgi:hypothetical protein
MEEETKPKNKGGRPTKTQKRENKMSFNATLSEKTLILSKAQRSGLRLADYLRDIALKGKVRNVATPEELQQYRELTGIANNLNQLTKEAHKQNMAYVLPKILTAISAINKTLKSLDNKNQDR